MNFSKTDQTNDAGESLWKCTLCPREIWTSKQRIVCACPNIKGLGDVVHKAISTVEGVFSAVGVKVKKKRKCVKCKRRRDKLNDMFPAPSFREPDIKLSE